MADYYTRDRSTPRLDSVWVSTVGVFKLLYRSRRKFLDLPPCSQGGEDSLLSGHAWEEDGR